MNNNELNTKENKNLLSRLRMKWHTAKICKAITALTIASVIALGSVSCANNNSTNSNNTQNNQTNSSQQDNQNNIWGDNNSNNSQNNEYSKYSKLLQNVMNNQDYKFLINSAKNNSTVYESGEFKGVPYSFLEKEGYDVEPFKTNELSCATYAFELENEQNTLYMMVRAETDAATPYYTEYILKFKLTEQEMDDYHMLHEGNYIQACFLNNELAKLKTPQILHKTRWTVDAKTTFHGSLLNMPTLKTYLGNKSIGEVSLLNYNLETQKFNIMIRSSLNRASMLDTGTINDIEVINWSKDIEINSDNAFYQPCKKGDFSIQKQDTTCANVIFYSSNIEEKQNTKDLSIAK